jgi:serine/threonine protein kinase
MENEMLSIDRFKIGKKLGEGSYGRVHECKIGKDRNFAVKILKKTDEGISSPLEMSIMIAYKHPNLNSANAITHDANHIYIIQSKAECDLETYLRSKRPINKQLWFKNMLQGLQCLHSEGIVHCDLKPSNVLVMQDGRVTLTDYSHSVLIIGNSVSFRHRVGSPRYCAPEVLSDIAWSKLIDIWSLGCIFYEISTKTKFLASITNKTSDRELLRTIKKREFENAIFEDNDKELILDYMLQCNPCDRYSASNILSIYFSEETPKSYCNFSLQKVSSERERESIKTLLKNRIFEDNILTLTIKIHETTPCIPVSSLKIETCFLLATKILKGIAPFHVTVLPHYKLLEMEMNICTEARFLLH